MTDVRLIGEHGSEWTFELPLAEAYAKQVKAGLLAPADDRSAEALAAPDAFEPEPTRVGYGTRDASAHAESRPAQGRRRR